MRTTIEIDDEHRARLLEIAARRGETGFSHLVGEAIELYLRSIEEDAEARRRALELCGVLSEEEAEELEDRARSLRKSWR